MGVTGARLLSTLPTVLQRQREKQSVDGGICW
jgi:hypothetical protein